MENLVLILKNNGFQIAGGMLSLAFAIIYLKRSLVQIKSTLAEVKTKVICDLKNLSSELRVQKNLIESNSRAIAKMEQLNETLIVLTERICVLEERVANIKKTKKKEK